VLSTVRAASVTADLVSPWSNVCPDMKKSKFTEAQIVVALQQTIVGEHAAGRVSRLGTPCLCDRAFASDGLSLRGPAARRAVRQRLKEIAATRICYGFERIHILLRRISSRQTDVKESR
jgi:hypothetical protein